MNDVMELGAPPGRLEKDALKTLFRLAYALTTRQGDIYVSRQAGGGEIRLEAWARELEPESFDLDVPSGRRVDAERAAYELGGHFEIDEDRSGRKVVFRIVAPA